MIWVADVEVSEDRAVLVEALKDWADVRWLSLANAREAKSSRQALEGGELLESELATSELASKLLEDRVFAGAGERSIYLNPLGGCGNDAEDWADAAAAKRMLAAGLKVGVLTVDGHAGTGIERALWELDGQLLTVSVHDTGTGGGTISGLEYGTFNAELGTGSGDGELLSAVREAVQALEDWGGCDVLLLVWGTCGLGDDGSTDMQWTVEGLGTAALVVGQAVARWNADVLMRVGGGKTLAAGGGQAILDAAVVISHTLLHEVGR